MANTPSTTAGNAPATTAGNAPAPQAAPQAAAAPAPAAPAAPAQAARAAKQAAAQAQGGAPGGLTKAQQAAVAASMATAPTAPTKVGSIKNAAMPGAGAGGAAVQVAAFTGLPMPRHNATLALTGRVVTKRGAPAARWAAFVLWHNATPAAARTVAAYVQAAPGNSTVADLQWAVAYGWLVLV